MEEFTNNPTDKRAYRAAGAVCFPMAAMLLFFAVIAILSLAVLIDSPSVNSDSLAVWFLFGMAKTVLFFRCVSVAGLFALIAGVYIAAGIMLIRRANPLRVEKALWLSFVISFVFLILSPYPLAIGLVGILGGGIKGNLFSFLAGGLLPPILSGVCILCNTIAARKHAILLLGRGEGQKVLKALRISFTIGLVIVLLSLYPSAIGLGKFIMHGIDGDSAAALTRGFLPLVVSVGYCIFNRVTFKKYKKSLVLKPL